MALYIMTILFIIVIGILSISLAVQSSRASKQVEINRQTVQLNKIMEQQNKELEQNISQQKQAISQLEEQFKNKSDALARLNSSVEQTAKQYEAIAQRCAEDEYNKKISQLEKEYEEKNESLTSDYTKILHEWEEKIKQSSQQHQDVQQQIEELEAKQRAYIEMKQREEEIAAQKDYYRLVISEQDLQDVKFLREVQVHLSHKEAIDKIIWDGYYKPAYNALMARIFKDIPKRCGIYRICCLNNDKAYVGQSLDIKERWRQHIKSALEHTSTTNKLYQEMKKFGAENFTFEIIEEVTRDKLNEREVYWIDFFKTKDYGLNGNRGGS